MPGIEVLIFTARETDELIHDVFAAEVKSYILKSEAGMYLIDAIKALSRHKPFFTDNVSKILFKRFCTGTARKSVAAPNGERLTPREREIARLLAEGKSSKGVADALGISLRTVETHRRNIMQKPGVGSMAGLIRYAIRNGIIDP